MSLVSSTFADAPDLAGKEKCIYEACEKDDIYAVANLATSPGGLVNDAVRRVACKEIATHDRNSS